MVFHLTGVFVAESMNVNSQAVKCGYTIVELMVTVVIVSVFAVGMGTFVSKLLSLQERDREEAYIREKLVDICATYADFLALSTNISTSASDFVASYRHETGGVSFETGRVSRVAELATALNVLSKTGLVTIDLNARSFRIGEDGLTNDFSRTMRGDDTPLVNPRAMKGLKIGDGNDGNVNLSFELEPLSTKNEDDALWNFKVNAHYKAVYAKGGTTNKTVTAERIVRLWNRL